MGQQPGFVNGGQREVSWALRGIVSPMAHPLPRLTTRYPGGSAANLRHAGEVVRFRAVRHESVFVMWWDFALRGDGGPVRCVWEQTQDVLGWPQLPAAVPVYYGPDGCWRRVDPRTCRHDADAHEFHFTVPTAPGLTRVAYCYPYGLDRVDALFAELAALPGVQVRELARSELGRPFRLLEFGEGPRHVWLTARHHAGEVQGTYVMEGLLRAALRSPRLRRAVTVHAAPVLDLDGVGEGWYGKDRGPRDFNRDYCARPCRPEVAALMRAAEAVGAADVMLDLHGPAPGDPTFLVPRSESALTPEQWRETWEFGRCLEALAPRRCPCRVVDWSPSSLNWSGAMMGQTASGWFGERFGGLAATLEATYHRSHDERLVTERDWLALGKSLARALEVHFGLTPAPAVEHIALPPTTVPRFREWRCVHWPQKARIRTRAGGLEITGDPAGGYCWMLALPVLTGRRASFVAELQGTVEQLAVTARGYDPARGLSTGETHDSVLRPAPGEQHFRVPSPGRHCQLFFRVVGLKGRLRLRLGGEGSQGR